MAWSTGMTIEQRKEAAENQRCYDLYQARMWRDHYQALVDKLESRDPLNSVSTGNE